MPAQPARSGAETLKEASRRLRGTIAAELAAVGSRSARRLPAS